MSTAHRPTFKAKAGGGGLRDGARAPPTLQHSARDQPGHKKLKYRDDIDRVKEQAKMDPFEEYFGQDKDNSLKGEPEAVSPDSESEFSSGIESISGSDDEALLYEELEKIRAERAERDRLVNNNPLLPATSNTSNRGLVRRWEEEGVVFRRHVQNTTDKKPTHFVNDTTRSQQHRDFMNKFVR